MIKSEKLSKFKSISHTFFNNKGGKSMGIYKSLNCGLGSMDKKINVLKNITIVCKKIGVSKKRLILLNQTHSNKCHLINKITQKKLKGDALITSNKKIAIGVLTADCVPILIYDNNKKIIAAIHAGWKGAFKGIVKNVLDLLKKNGSNCKDLVVAIGPCISQRNYEVKKEFKNKFIKKDKSNDKLFKFRKDKIYFDLRGYIYLQLKKYGVKSLDIIKKDTYIPKNNFFSARRSLSNKNNDYGRNISIIMIN